MFYELLTGGIISITTFSVLVAVPLYILVLSVIIINRNVEPFNSGFFLIFFALGTSDLASYFLYFMRKVIFFGCIPTFFLPYGEANTPAAIYDYLVWVCSIFHYQLTFVLTFNRFISIVFPVLYSTYLTRSKTHIIILVCAFNAAVFASPLLFSNCQFTQYMVELDGINRTFISGPSTSNKTTSQYLTVLWMIEVYGLLLANSFFYAMMLKSLRKVKLMGNKRKLELQMFWLGFMVFAIHAIFAVYFFFRDFVLVNLSVNPHVHEWILYFLTDLYDLPNGFILWCTSSPIRKILIGTFKDIFRCGPSTAVVLINPRTITGPHTIRPLTTSSAP